MKPSKESRKVLHCNHQWIAELSIDVLEISMNVVTHQDDGDCVKSELLLQKIGFDTVWNDDPFLY